MTLPKPLYNASHAITNDNKYVIIFGGLDGSIQRSDDILVLCTEKMETKRSKIRMSISTGRYDEYKAIIPNNKMNDELTSFGFVRNIWKR